MTLPLGILSLVLALRRVVRPSVNGYFCSSVSLCSFRFRTPRS